MCRGYQYHSKSAKCYHFDTKTETVKGDGLSVGNECYPFKYRAPKTYDGICVSTTNIPIPSTHIVDDLTIKTV